MFAFLSYNGAEPGWASALRESDFPGLYVYSPGLPLEDQLEAIGDALSARKPNVMAYASAETLRLEENIWLSFCDALPTLLAADSCTVTSQMVYRDLYLLMRADVLIVDAHSTNELAVYASLSRIPVVAVSYSPTGVHPWLAHCAQTTVNSPESVQQIMEVFMPASTNFGPRQGTEVKAKSPETSPDCQDDCNEHETCREPVYGSTVPRTECGSAIRTRT